MKFRTTPLEKKWIWYDVGNSAFTLLVSTLLPIFFSALTAKAGVTSSGYFSLWAIISTVATVISAFLGLLLGAVADFSGMKKKLFSLTVLVGAVGCTVLGFCVHWIWFILVFVIAKVAYQLSLVIYDSMLIDVTSPDRSDEVSSRGYAWGYIGSCAPFVLTIGIYLLYYFELISLLPCMVMCCIIIAAWWVGWSVPVWKDYKQSYYLPLGSHPVKECFTNLGKTFKDVAKDKKVLFFLLAFFFYIDGVYTIIDLATSYGESLGLNSMWLLIALLVTQIVAFPAALIFGKLTHKVKPEIIIAVCICAYFAITVFAAFMNYQWQFWVLAVCVGLFQGTIQSLSRSYFTKIIPPEKSGEYFSLYDILGKGASILGTAIAAVVTIATNNQHIAVGVLSVMFPIGLVFFLVSAKLQAKKEGGAAEEAEALPEEKI
ncbi:MAG: MFS transporter [Clostridia bacterium]|nr:MFS transporter [Clostridia bacterium]